MNQLTRDYGRYQKEDDDAFDPSLKRIGPYIITDKVIGQGTTGIVKLALHTTTNSYSAVKVVDKSVEHRWKEAKKEIKILSQVKHHDTKLIHMEHVEEDHQNIYIFMQYCEMGDLFTYIENHGTLEEMDARKLFIQLLEAVEVCHHKLHICHHDIKLENCVIDSGFHLWLIDYGFAVEMDTGEAGRGNIEIYDMSPAYSPLEILLRRPHNETVDVFSMGVCLYFMLYGEFPFCDPDKTSMEDLVQNLQVNAPDFPSGFSVAVEDLITQLLAKKKNRITLEEIRNHSWLQSEWNH